MTLLLTGEFNTRLDFICLLVDRIPRMANMHGEALRCQLAPRKSLLSVHPLREQQPQSICHQRNVFYATFSAFSPSSHCRDGCWKKYLQHSDCRGTFAACEDNDMAFVAERGLQRWSYSRENMSVVYYCLRVQQI